MPYSYLGFSIEPTMWKFQNFSVTQILREIKVCDVLKGTKTAILIL